MTTKHEEIERIWDGVFQAVMSDLQKRYKVSDTLYDILSDSLSEHLSKVLTSFTEKRDAAILAQIEERIGANAKSGYEVDYEETNFAAGYNHALTDALEAVRAVLGK